MFIKIEKLRKNPNLIFRGKILKSAGYIFALVALTLSALGTIFTKMMTGSFAKFVIPN